MNTIKSSKTPLPSKGKITSFAFVCIIVLLYAFLWWITSDGWSRKISLLLYYFNWHHWPWWYAVNFWVIAIGFALACFVTRRKVRICLNVALFMVAVTVTVLNSIWLHALFYRVRSQLGIFYRTVVVPYFYAPVTDFFTDGTVSGRLCLVPTAALVIIILLLYWNSRIKKHP